MAYNCGYNRLKGLSICFFPNDTPFAMISDSPLMLSHCLKRVIHCLTAWESVAVVITPRNDQSYASERLHSILIYE